jgi:hypothetical protein
VCVLRKEESKKQVGINPFDPVELQGIMREEENASN